MGKINYRRVELVATLQCFVKRQVLLIYNSYVNPVIQNGILVYGRTNRSKLQFSCNPKTIYATNFY